MNSFPSVTSQKNQDNSEVLLNITVKQAANGRTVTIVPELPELQVEGCARPLGHCTTALAQLQQRLETHLAGAEIVSISVKLPSTEHKNPWLAMAGVFKDDPQFEQMLSAIENYRNEIDLITEETFPQE